MQSLALDVNVVSEEGQRAEMRDEDDDLLRAAEELGIDLSGVRAGEPTADDEATAEADEDEAEDAEAEPAEPDAEPEEVDVDIDAEADGDIDMGELDIPEDETTEEAEA